MTVIIIGAGISGLALGFFLQTSNKKNSNNSTGNDSNSKCHDVIILERDSEFNSERQGFSLTMQANTKHILEEYGLLEEIDSLGFRAKEQIFMTNTGETLFQNSDNDTSRFNFPLPRQSIRNTFYSKLEPGTVHWNTKVVDIQGNHSDGFTVITADLRTFKADIIVACDGINSQIRKKYFPDLKLNNLGLCNVYGITKLEDLNPEDKDHFYSKEVQVFDGELRFFSKPFDAQSTNQMWELTWPTGSEFEQLYHRYEIGENIKADALKLCQTKIDTFKMDWLHNFFNLSKAKDIIVHPLYDLDPGSADDIDPTKIPLGIFMIGDTIHPMSPYKGMGANEAFLDAYLLAKKLLLPYNSDSNSSDAKELDPIKVNDFYREMITRTSKTVLRSREITQFYHTEAVLDKEKLWRFKGW